MNKPKIIDDSQINWNREETSRLSYEMIFKEQFSSDTKEEDELDIEELLEKKQQEWKKKLQQATEEAYQNGLDEGLKKGLEEARSEIDIKLKGLENAFQEAHVEWQERQQILETGLLNLVFEISETILGMPVENPAIREKLDGELGPLLQKLEEHTKPFLLVSEADFEYVQRLKDRIAPKTTVTIHPDKTFNSGEFKLETNHETVVHQFQTMLSDFKESLSLPLWNP